jgi:hypothetical protein
MTTNERQEKKRTEALLTRPFELVLLVPVVLLFD